MKNDLKMEPRLSGSGWTPCDERDFMEVMMFNIKKRIRMSLITLLFLFLTVNMALAAKSFRCGNDLVSIGDFSFQILTTCGEPVFKEEIGYTIKNNERELKIEVWTYGPRGGRYYYLTFEGGKLVEIKDVRQ